MAEAHEPSLSIGSAFQGSYEILGRLGAGRFGQVYKARRLSTGQEVAIRVLRILPDDTAAHMETRRARFRREMRLCAGLSHPNIVRLIDSGEAEDGMLYAVTEHVPGATLREVLAAEGALPRHDTLHLMTQVLDALACAHARGVVHRDLKPDNIMVTSTSARRNARVLNFGLAGLAQGAENGALPWSTATHEIMGTRCYAAPEQLRGEPPSARSDLYSWGLIFLECVTGELAVSGGSGADVICKQLGPDPVAIPPWLRKQRLGRLLEIVTAKEVEKRDVTIEGLLEALRTSQLTEAPAPAEAAGKESLPDGERRQLTVISCRLTVWSLENRPADPEEVDEALHALHARYTELAACAGGQIAGVLADRVFLVFGYPRAHEHDARRAVRTALEVAAEARRAAGRLGPERRLRVEARVGVHTGLVVVRELRHASHQRLYDLVGLTPQIAARLDELAGPGEVLVSGDTRRLLRDDLAAEPAGELRPSGHAVVLPVFRLIGDAGWREAETIRWVRETPLVGRAVQLRELLEAWKEAQAGRPGVMFLQGEPGIGKSRLVRELRRRVPPDGWLQARCIAETQATPLRPVVDLLLAAREPIERMLARYRFDLAETLPLFASLLSRPLDPGYSPLSLTPERGKELTLQAILTLLLRMAEERPLVLAIEDLHWADPTTLELVTLLVQEVRTAQILAPQPPARLSLVFTARPDLTPPWSLQDVTLIQLPRLARHDVAEMVSAGLSTGKGVPGALLDKIVDYSDGVPLFVEEVTRVLLEGGQLADDVDTRTVDRLALEIPATLRDLLNARLDRLSRSARETIQIAAVLGREFRYEVLSAATRRDEWLLRDDLRELLEAGLLFVRRSMHSESYVFKHSLVRDAAYESLTKPARQRLHQRIAETLRQRFHDVERSRPEILAYHFERGGKIEAAVEYSHRAGSLALHRAAYQEAFTLLDHALSLLCTTNESPAQRRQEVEVLSTLGSVQIATRGYAAPEVEETFRRAWRLCEDLGGDLPTHVLYGAWGVHVTRSNREGVDALLSRWREIAAHSTDLAARTAAYAAIGCGAYWAGDLRASEHYFALGRALFRTEEFRQFSETYGYGAGLYSHAFGMLTLWLLGHPDRANAVRDELYRIVEQAGDPYVMAVALGLGLTLAHDRDEAEVELALADRLTALAVEQRMPIWQAAGAVGRGGALLRAGDPKKALPLIQAGLEGFRGIGVMCSYNYFLQYLADAYLRADLLENAATTVEEALALCETLVCRLHRPEMLRLKGEVLLLRNEPAAAEACLRQAVELARRWSSRGHELRAATSLARLLRERGRASEGRTVLGDVYSWFTEGFETPDLRTARMLLAELA